MTWLDWLLYAGVVFAAGAIGTVVGQSLLWRRRGSLIVPARARGEGRRNTGAMLLALLAIVTVLSSLLTSFEVRRSASESLEFADQQRECTEDLSRRLADRSEFGERNRANIGRFVAEFDTAMRVMEKDQDKGRRLQREAAERFLHNQDQIESERAELPLRADICR